MGDIIWAVGLYSTSTPPEHNTFGVFVSKSLGFFFINLMLF